MPEVAAGRSLDAVSAAAEVDVIEIELENFVLGELALDLARNAAIRGKIPVGIFSLEMSKEQLVDRLICSEANVDLWRMRTGKLSDRPDADAVIMPGGNWPAMSIIERLERELGKPVISTTQASLWAALRMIGRIEGVAGYGRLLRDLTAPSQQTQLA